MGGHLCSRKEAQYTYCFTKWDVSEFLPFLGTAEVQVALGMSMKHQITQWHPISK